MLQLLQKPNVLKFHFLIADSLDIVEMLMALEEEYGVTIEDSKMAELKTVGDVVACVEGMI